MKLLRILKNFAGQSKEEYGLAASSGLTDFGKSFAN
jgi:hypothetical protein